MERLLAALLVVSLTALPTKAEVFSGSMPEAISIAESEALRIWRPLAKQGDVNAQRVLGLMYLEGNLVPQNYVKAIKWCKKAAVQGDAISQHFLGFMNHQGKGIPENHGEAVKWYKKAADKGYALSQYALGIMYEEGVGVLQDYVTAHVWFNLAAAQGYRVAARNRDKVAKRMTTAQVAEAHHLAAEWMAALKQRNKK